MTKNLTKISNWLPISSKDEKNDTFSTFLGFISQFESGTTPDMWVKWKNYSDQVVIKAKNNFYKIYKNDYVAGSFWTAIRCELANIYQEKYGIKWDIVIREHNKAIYTLEKRQNLTVCEPGMLSFEELLFNWNEILVELENRLALPAICEQLQAYIPNLHSLKIVRNCINKFADYALTDTGQIVLLDDSDFFIAMIDKNGEWMNEKFHSYKVITTGGEMVFGPEGLLEEDSETHHEELVNKWQIYDMDIYIGKTEKEYLNQRENMLRDTIKVITTQKPLENKQLETRDFDYYLKIGNV